MNVPVQIGKKIKLNKFTNIMSKLIQFDSVSKTQIFQSGQYRVIHDYGPEKKRS